MPPSNPGRPRILGAEPALDGIRGAAIIGVLLNHWIFIVSGKGTGWFPAGFLAVDLFLVLSGFLITSTLLREYDRSETIDFVQFARRRLRRLMPPLVLFFAVHAVVVAAIGDPLRTELIQAVLALTFVGNWQQSFGHRPPFDLVHLWSLALEGQMYLIWGAAVFAMRRRLHDARRIAIAIAGLIVMIMLWRTAWYLADADLDAIYVRTDTRADSVLMGALGAFVWRARLIPDRWSRAAGVPAAMASVAVWVLATRDSIITFSIGFTFVAALALVVTLSVMDPSSHLRSLMGTRPLRYTGSISFSLYLWHLPIFVWSARAFPDVTDQARFVGAVLVSYAAAAISHRLSERPFLRS